MVHIGFHCPTMNDLFTPNRSAHYEELEETLNQLFEIAQSLPTATALTLAEGIQRLSHCYRELHRELRDDSLESLARCTSVGLRAQAQLSEVYAGYSDELQRRHHAESLSSRLLAFARRTLVKTDWCRGVMTSSNPAEQPMIPTGLR